MRLYVLEIKRLLKTRSVGLLIIAALVLSAVLSYLPVTYIQAYKTDKSGDIQIVTGIEAIKAKKADKKALHGEMTEAKIRETIADVKEVLKEYGSLDRQNIPLEVYVEKVYPHLDIIGVLEQTVVPNGKSLYTLEYSDINEDDAENVYAAYKKTVGNLNKNPEVQKKINQMTRSIQMPFVYYPEISTDQLDYYEIYMFLVMIFFMVIITPVFAAEYQTGADQILRCTKHGRLRLALTKIAVTFTLVVAVFVTGTTIFSIIMRVLYGAEPFKNPLQMLGYLYYIPAFTVGKMYKFMAVGALFSLMAVAASTLFFSAKCKNVQSALISAFVTAFVPMVIYTISNGRNIFKILRCIFPTSGLAFMNSLEQELLARNFVKIGSGYYWTPYVIMIAVVICIPVFLIVTVVSYCKREA
mgnify:FL=1